MWAQSRLTWPSLGELAPSALALYVEVGRRELAIARRRAELDPAAAQAMAALLDDASDAAGRARGD